METSDFLFPETHVHLKDVWYLSMAGAPEVPGGTFEDTARVCIPFAELIDEIEPLQIVGMLPFTGFGYVIEEEGVAEEVIQTLNLWRLHDVASLAFLQMPGALQGAAGTLFQGRYQHNRFMHILDVYAFAVLMADRCGLSEDETVHLMVAALTHDALTPAGGDTTKRIQLTLFDEDLNYRSLFKRNGWPLLREKYNLSEDLLAETILGKGILGRILDLADKLAYVSRDVYHMLWALPRGLYGDCAIERDAISGIVERNRFVCGLWDSVEIANGNIAITNVTGLCEFLKLRALMFRVLYYNAESRFFEDCLARICIEYLLEKGELTKDALLSMRDSGLIQCMEKVLGFPDFFIRLDMEYDPHVYCFKTLGKAIAKERELARNQHTLSRISEAKPLSTNGIASFPVKTRIGVMPLSEVRPDAVRCIGEIMEDRTPVRLFSFSTKELRLPPDLVKKLRRERDKRLQTSVVTR